MAQQGLTKRKAEKLVRKARSLLPKSVTNDRIYMKLFKDMPRTDVEMIFPNTPREVPPLGQDPLWCLRRRRRGHGCVRYHFQDRPHEQPDDHARRHRRVGGVLARQVSSFVAQRNRYMVVMAQNSISTPWPTIGRHDLLASRAAEEDMKEEILLYCALAQGPVPVNELDRIDRTIEAI